VRASFYRGFAEHMSAEGVSVFLMEQRGHGRSPYRASRSDDFTCHDYVEEDIKTTIAWIKESHTPKTPLYVGGHSMGGHMSACFAGLYGDEIDGFMTIACGLPHPDVFDGKIGKRITKLSRFLPFILFLWGYFPGERIGFAGREYKSYMLDWLGMVKTGDYAFKGMSGDIEAGIKKFKKPVYIFSVEADDFAPIKSALAIGEKFTGTEVKHKHLLAGDLNGHTGHFDWVKGMKSAAPKIAAVLVGNE
jgi:predicted alpha/beta hydrolase